jgi:ryanodine receptor 2
MKEGWRYGEERDSANKQTPNLVPYKDLPESEKEYDRHTATEAIKVLLSLGYDIRKRG